MLFEQLQRIQNCAARLITGSGKSEHITPLLRELHWIPVKYRLHFKVNTFTLNWHTTDVIESHSHLNDIAIYQ